jgi:hypothetical protein
VYEEGPLFLLDRADSLGESTQFDETALAYSLESPLMLESLGLLHYWVGGFLDASADRWLRLDTLEGSHAHPLTHPLTRLGVSDSKTQASC